MRLPGFRGSVVTIVIMLAGAAFTAAQDTAAQDTAAQDTGSQAAAPGDEVAEAAATAQEKAQGEQPVEKPLPVVIQLRDIGMIQAHAAALLLSDQGGGEVEGAMTWALRAGGEPVPQLPATLESAEPVTAQPAVDPAVDPVQTAQPEPGAVSEAAASPAADEQAESASEPVSAKPPIAGPSLPVAFVVEIDGETLLQGHQQEGLAVGVYGYVISQDKQEIANHFAYGASVAVADYEQQLRGSGLQLAGELLLPPGSYALRLLVRNHQTDAYYLGRSSIEVPVAGTEEWSVLPPVFPSAGTWLNGRLEGNNPEPPLATAEGPIHPAARPVLVDGQPTVICLGGTGWSDEVAVTARIVDYQGRTFDEPEVSLDDMVDGLPAGVSMRQATVAAFDVPPGKYRLVLGMQDTEAEQRATRTLPILVVPEQAPRAWAGVDLLALRRERTLGPNALDPRAKIKDLHPARVYHEALGMLAQSDEAGARNAVAELERSAFAISPTRGLAEIRGVIMKTARQLGEVSPESLTAVIKLHHDLVHSYTVHNEPPLIMHAWMLTADLAELGCAKARSRECRRSAANTLVSLACYLLDAKSEESAGALFNRALRFDPGHLVALFGLAVINERLGEYSMALGHLERLVKIDPGAHEARLHMAVNAARLGHQRQAVRAFRGLTRGQAPRWVRAVAYQELAQLLIDKKNLDEAEKLLREAAERLPENQRMLIQLALVLDLNHQPVEAARILEQLRPQPDGGEDSPRLRYASWVPPEFTTVRHRLNRDARGAFASLDQSLPSIKPRRGWGARKKRIYASPNVVEPKHTLQFNANMEDDEGGRRRGPRITPSSGSGIMPAPVMAPVPRSGR